MKKLLIILFILLSTSCFKTIDFSLDRTDSGRVSGMSLHVVGKSSKIEEECRVNCLEYTVSTIEWCECMDACLNKKDNMKIKIEDCEPDSIKSN